MAESLKTRVGRVVAGGLHALRLGTGAEAWVWRPKNDCQPTQRNCIEAHSAAVRPILSATAGTDQ